MLCGSGIKQRRQRYQRDGLVGQADGRSAKQMPSFDRVAPAVVEAMRQAIEETTEASSKTIGFVVWRATQILASREDVQDIVVPSQRTLYRLFDKLAAGTHATGSATTRRSVHARPAGPFGEVPACAPGEWMQIDSTPLDVLVRLEESIAEKVKLTAMIDLATRSLAAAVLRPTTKAADASALLARTAVCGGSAAARTWRDRGCRQGRGGLHGVRQPGPCRVGGRCWARWAGTPTRCGASRAGGEGPGAASRAAGAGRGQRAR